MQLYDPTAQPPARHLIRAPAPSNLQGATIGILSNGKLNADLLLHETAALFEASHGCRIGPVLSKSNASAPASDETMAALQARSDLLLTANGD